MNFFALIGVLKYYHLIARKWMADRATVILQTGEVCKVAAKVLLGAERRDLVEPIWVGLGIVCRTNLHAVTTLKNSA